RYRGKERRRRAFAVFLTREQEERLVPAVVELRNPNGTVDAEAVLIQVVIDFRRLVHSWCEGPGVEQERVRVEPLAAVVLRHAAVEIVRARLEGDVDDASRRAAVLRVVRVRA